MHFKRLLVLARALWVNYRYAGLPGFFRSIKGKIDGTYPLTPLRNDKAFIVRMRTTDLAVCSQVFEEQQYAYDAPLPVRWIIDAGANIGCSAVYFARKYPDARIVCIEADQANYEVLKLNCSSIPNIVCIHAALWPADGQVEIHNAGDGAWALRAQDLATDADPAVGTRQVVEAITLRSLMKRFSIDEIDILKIDIEGGEREVLADGPSILKDVNVLAVECHDRWAPGCTRNVMHATSEFDFEWIQSESMFFCKEGWLPSALNSADFGRIPAKPGIV